MEEIFGLAVPLAVLAVLVRLILLPARLIWKLLLHSLSGFVCLWLVNSLTFITGITIPINAVTALMAGVLGIPGIGLLALLQTAF